MFHTLVIAAGSLAAAAGDPVAPGSGVEAVFDAGTTELNVAVPLILVGVAGLMGLGWVIRSAFIANRAAKKAAGQIGS
jgi:hypothetical protein